MAGQILNKHLQTKRMSITIPHNPDSFTGASVMAKLVDTVSVRYQLAIQGLTQDDKDFRVTPESMSMLETQKHIFLLMRWIAKSVDAPIEKAARHKNFDDFKEDILTTCAVLSRHLQGMDDAVLEKSTIYLKRADTHYPIWNVIGGPLSDALHHIGQIVSWRRINGNPVPRISPFTGESY